MSARPNDPLAGTLPMAVVNALSATLLHTVPLRAVQKWGRWQGLRAGLRRYQYA